MKGNGDLRVVRRDSEGKKGEGKKGRGEERRVREDLDVVGKGRF